LFCLIGLLPSGCSDSDLNALWGDGWHYLAEKLLRSSLLVKKNGENGENRYSLFPFMNQYAESLMNEEDLLAEHKRICKYLARICKEILKYQQSDIRLNKLVEFETNIWACIYRMVEHKLHSCDHKDNIARAKSPGLPQHLIRSSYTNDGLMFSQAGGNDLDDSGSDNKMVD
jgi:hypothetical protein